ncbi:MAG: FAD:protein FMN transferase [Bacteroidaceae bacterium]|nr:FAD:protein FMN transferase [Bacteroidaceae bacterium]
MKIKKIVNLLFLIFLIVGTVLILRKHSSTSLSYQTSEGAVFGTYYHITYEHTTPLDSGINAELDKVNASLSMFNQTSTLARINKGESILADSLFAHVFTLAEKVSAETDGAFDATVAPLVNAWGFGFKHSESVTPALLDSLMDFVGYTKVRLQNDSVVKDDPRLMLDFGAIAKGYAVDVVARMLEQNGVQNYMVEIGGEVVLKGKNAEDNLWRIGVSKPEVSDSVSGHQLQAVFQLTDIALATSGNYRNFYYKDGKIFAHTINPATGYPVQHSLLSASVFASTCAEADAYATAFMVMGLDKAKEFISARSDLMAYFIYADAKGRFQVWYSPALKNHLQPVPGNS